MGERTKIAAAVVLLDAGELKTRNDIRKIDFDQQESFIVSKTDIVFRTKFFDELPLQKQSFRFTSHRVNFKIPNAVQQSARFQIRYQPPRWRKILC
jgi:hypothetical protein